MKYQEIVENTISYAIRNKCIDSLNPENFNEPYKSLISEAIQNEVQSLMDFADGQYCMSIDKIDSICEKLEIIDEMQFIKGKRRLAESMHKAKTVSLNGKMEKGIISYEDYKTAVDDLIFSADEEQSYSHISEATNEYVNHSKGDGIKIGIDKFDSKNDGLFAPELVILAARPGVGKTAIAIEILNRTCVNDGLPTLFISSEMNKRQIAERKISNGLQLDNKKIRKKEFEGNERRAIGEYIEKLNKSKLYINDKTGITIEQIAADTKKAVKKHGVGMLLVDYLQLIKTKKKFYSEVDRVSYISYMFKKIAKDNNIPVVALAQLNRGSEKSGSKPVMGDLKGSSGIEENADIILLLGKIPPEELSPGEQADTKESGGIVGYIWFIIAKYREGGTCYFRMRNVKNTYTFQEYYKTEFEGGE